MAEEAKKKDEAPEDGLEFIQWLREKSENETPSYQKFYRHLSFRAREKGIPVHGQFELTPLCNFSCKMCYVHLDPNQMNGHELLSVDTWKNLMLQAWEAGMLRATLTGGECLTYPGFDELFLYLHSLGCEVSVLTNGFLLDEKRIAFFKEHKPTSIQITLYGWNDDVYERVTGQRAFEVVANNIRKAVEADLPIRVSVTPSTYLGRDVLETIRIGKTLGKAFAVNSGLFDPREETGRSGQSAEADTDLYVEIYRLLDELNGRERRTIDADKLPPAGGPNHECKECGLLCGGGRSSFVVDWKGTMMACNRMNMLRADFLHEGFAAAWKTVNEGANSWPRVPECEGCPYAQICNNCAANMLRFAEPGKQPYELCERMKYFVKCGIREIPECD